MWGRRGNSVVYLHAVKDDEAQRLVDEGSVNERAAGQTVLQTETHRDKVNPEERRLSWDSPLHCCSEFRFWSNPSFLVSPHCAVTALQ